MEKVGRS